MGSYESNYIKGQGVDLNNITDWSISEKCLFWIITNIPNGSNIIEFGSGTGTIELSRFYNVWSVENNKEYLLSDKVNYILTDIIDGWYDPKLFNKFPDDYKLVLIDGPLGKIGRMGILKYIDKFDKNVKFIVDDTHRDDEYNLAIELSSILKRSYNIVEDNNKSFAII